MDTSVRIATLNTWKCDGLYDNRLVTMAEMFKRIRPDIIALQEVFSCPETGDDTGEFLAKKLHLNCFSLKIRKKNRPFKGANLMSSSGLTVLSRYMVTGINFELPSDPRDGERYAQSVLIDVSGHRVHLINTHLTHLRDQDALRCSQMLTILQNVEAQSNGNCSILCGDFNAELSSPELQRAIEKSILIIADTYPLGNGEEPRNSLLPVNGKQRGRNRCIDFILSASRRGAGNIFSHAQCIGNIPDASGNYPSDHCGFSIDMNLSNNRKLLSY